MSNREIIRLSTGYVNTVNDAVIGMSVAPGGLGVSKFTGQLGKAFSFTDDNIRFDSSVGTVYGGVFRYVRLAAAASAVAIGQTLFYDLSVADSLAQVTTVQTGGTDLGVLPAGIVLNPSWTAGYYGVIQVAGPINVKFRAALTSAGAIGSPVFVCTAGGADLGLADVIETADPATYADITLFQRWFIGTARQAPTNGGTKTVYCNFLRNTPGV